jgi:hypothetical protein
MLKQTFPEILDSTKITFGLDLAQGVCICGAPLQLDQLQVARDPAADNCDTSPWVLDLEPQPDVIQGGTSVLVTFPVEEGCLGSARPDWYNSTAAVVPGKGNVVVGF